MIIFRDKLELRPPYPVPILAGGLPGPNVFQAVVYAAPRPILEHAIYKERTEEPMIKIRTTFPESWIFDSFDKKYDDKYY